MGRNGRQTANDVTVGSTDHLGPVGRAAKGVSRIGIVERGRVGATSTGKHDVANIQGLDRIAGPSYLSIGQTQFDRFGARRYHRSRLNLRQRPRQY